MRSLLASFLLAATTYGPPIAVDANKNTIVTGSGTTTAETLACASPCTVASTNVVVANANTGRSQCSFQSIGTVALYGCLNATTCSSSAYDFVLGYPGGASGAGAATASYIIGPQPKVWRGGITFAGASGGVLVANCY